MLLVNVIAILRGGGREPNLANIVLTTVEFCV